jgi:protein tyrosine/serine phosphatase
VKRANFRAIVLAGLLGAASLLSGADVAWSQPADPTPGLPNFGRVTDMLYRGAQPASQGFSALQAMGVGIVVNFRNEPGEVAQERRQVESLGIKYVSIPWTGWDEPSNAQVVQFLDLVRANPQAKIFVHCQRGADRTGVMIAAYRIAVEHKTVAEAVSEMHQFHYTQFWLPHLQRYVYSLPKLLQDDPQFTAYAAVANAVAGAAAAPATSSTSPTIAQ